MSGVGVAVEESDPGCPAKRQHWNDQIHSRLGAAERSTARERFGPRAAACRATPLASVHPGRVAPQGDLPGTTRGTPGSADAPLPPSLTWPNEHDPRAPRALPAHRAARKPGKYNNNLSETGEDKSVGTGGVIRFSSSKDSGGDTRTVEQADSGKECIIPSFNKGTFRNDTRRNRADDVGG